MTRPPLHVPELVLPPAAQPGMTLAQVDTPSLLLDLDAFERNLDRMQAHAARAGVALRPHAKAHKCPAIALAQVARGAVGVCCQKVSEALPFMRAGVSDIHVSNEIAGPAKARMLATLARHARLSVCVDAAQQVAVLAEAASAAEARLTVLVEIDVGQRRCGVGDAEQALALVDCIDRHPSLRFGGLQAYHGGAQHRRTRDERREEARRAAEKTGKVLVRLQTAGVTCDVVTGGGTGSVEFDLASGVYTEVQPGSYVFMDGDYGRNEWADAFRFEQSLYIDVEVMSVAAGDRVIVDAGLKSMAVDSGLPGIRHAPGDASGAASALRYVAANDEHGIIETDSGALPPLGTRLLLVPGHCDPTLNLYDEIIGFRGETVECVWAVAARGFSR
ncbi:D-serine deaminase, pyridoxal phosphate-dependent [Noviherbaspirillum humi]|uniref:D-serine deaminase, pyridoxal phosphate-dependent n=1 Tax=Noviherbaspirillum humi TaxID=1688639 RepID=A0A239FG34_9BURK|nr:DSD1 family PLP-dependent enzyme [Noviherbaspirillum humi]SNS55112.1 D-serine deaminase, pyridoxal phosphate-dependent [Noviherbaspirillum humi]